ncbi:MAG: DUF433 domain-containing protein [Candidatus Paceibacterota bacterium]
MIVDHRIAGTRITVWDVLHHLKNDWSLNEIAEVLRLSDQQVQAAVDYIHAHQDELVKVHQQIEARNAQANPPEVQDKLAAARARRIRWLEERQKTMLR